MVVSTHFWSNWGYLLELFLLLKYHIKIRMTQKKLAILFWPEFNQQKRHHVTPTGPYRALASPESQWLAVDGLLISLRDLRDSWLFSWSCLDKNMAYCSEDASNIYILYLVSLCIYIYTYYIYVSIYGFMKNMYIYIISMNRVYIHSSIHIWYLWICIYILYLCKYTLYT